MSEGFVTGRSPRTGDLLRIDYAAGRISAIERGGENGERHYIAPGFVDLQVNGFAGDDFNGGALTTDIIEGLAENLLRRGVTTFLPTLITAAPASIEEALSVIAAARRASSRLAHMMPFVHLEGPWIAGEDGPRGAHPREHVCPPDLDQFARWQRASQNLIGLVTLSPHFPNAVEAIRVLVGQGVIVSIGHTNATPEQVRAAVDAGARLSTHLGNGAAAVLPRHPNFIWTQLADDRLTACFIADGHHLSGDVFKAMLRAKGLDHAIIVSDTAAAGGLAPGLYDQKIGGKVELGEDGRLSMAGTPYLAGAATPLPDAVARAVELGAISLADAIDLGTRNPGRLVGGRGRIEIGAPADLVRFAWQSGDRSLSIDSVVLQGEPV